MRPLQGFCQFRYTSLIAIIMLFGSASALAGALQCDGTNDFTTVLDSSGDLDPGTSVTIEAWMKLDTYLPLGSTVSGFPGSLALGQGGISSAMKPGFSVSIPSTDTAFGSENIPLNTWVHIAGTYDGTDIKVYVDGDLVATQNHPGTAIDLTEARFCRFMSGEQFMDGAIDEVRWWNSVLSESEIADNRFFILNGNESGLVGYWRFEEASGQDIFDSSTSQNDGVLGSSNAAGDDDPSRIQGGAPVVVIPLQELGEPVPAMNAFALFLLTIAIGLVAYTNRRRFLKSA